MNIESMWCWCSHHYNDHEEAHECLDEICPCYKFLNAAHAFESDWYLKQVKVSMK